MGKKISQITATESSALSTDDVFEGEEAGGTSFKFSGTVINNTLAAASIALTNKTLTSSTNLFNRYTLMATSVGNTPADATNYYFGPFTSAMGAAATNQRLYIPYPGTITRAYLFWTCAAGTNEQSTISIRLNDTTDTAITTTADFSSNIMTANKTNLSIAVVAGDYITIKWLTPTWVTKPTSLSANVVMFIE